MATAKEWVELTQDDVLEILKDGYTTEREFFEAVRVIDATQAKLKELNDNTTN